MSLPDLDLYLLCACAVSVALGVFNLLRIRTRGHRALAMAIGNFALGIELLLFRAESPVFIQAGLGVIIFASLAADIAMKSTAPRAPKDDRR